MPEPSEPPPDPVAPPTMDFSPGQVEARAEGDSAPVGQAFGDYELLGEIERGGMGVVYRARARHSGQLVALKMMLGESASSSAELSRFILEAQATGELNHPGIVAIHAWGIHENHPFYTMDFVPGQPLHRLLTRGPLPIPRAVRLMIGIARALGAAHALGIVHRDLKPGNIMIDGTDQPRVLDFGLAKRRRTDRSEDDVPEVLPIDEPPPHLASPIRPTTPQTGPLTEVGAILGTPSYMAPEQVRAEHSQIGPPADVHALGAIFQEMLTGEPPYKGESTYTTLMQVIQNEPPPLRALRREIPPLLESVVSRCLAKVADDRYPDATAMADDLERRWQSWNLRRRFARLALTAAGALVALQIVQPLLVAGSAGARGFVEDWISDALHAPAPLQSAASLLDRQMHALIVIGGPLLGAVGLISWSIAWLWQSHQRLKLCLGWSAAAVFSLGMAWLLGLTDMPYGTVFLPWVLGVNAQAVIAASLVRRSLVPAHTEESRAPRESYLGKLFTVRGSHQVAHGPKRSGAVELADFELGKAIHLGEDGTVHWAKQKSLDRPVLVWRAVPKEVGAGPPGVMVRHPDVLVLHAISRCPDGHLLVTEPVAASPLAEVLGQRELLPQEAIPLIAHIARAVQAFHDQGACHGRISPDWILVRGELEPVLCPCGVPSTGRAERIRDVQDLGTLLLKWLPKRGRLWELEMLAPVYRTADRAVAGTYERPGDLDTDLHRALRAGQIRWRERWALVAAFVLVIFAGVVGWVGGAGSSTVDSSGLTMTLLGLCPATSLFGFTLMRGMIQRRRISMGDAHKYFFPQGVRNRIGKAVAFTVLTLVLGSVALALGQRQGPLVRPLAALTAVLVGFGFFGICCAGILTFAEHLLASIRPKSGEID